MRKIDKNEKGGQKSSETVPLCRARHWLKLKYAVISVTAWGTASLKIEQELTDHLRLRHCFLKNRKEKNSL